MRTMRTCCVLALFGLLLCTVAALAAKSDALLQVGEPYYEYVPDQVLVKFTSDVSRPHAEGLIAQINGSVYRYSDLLNFYTVNLSERKPVVDAVKELRAMPQVEWANFNYIGRAFWTPNDPYYANQWHYGRINMEQAWDITRGQSSVIAADADEGYTLSHEDFQGVPIVSPYDAVDGDNNPSIATCAYISSHGMHTAGTILAATNNGTGVAGVAHLCSFMPIRVLDDSGRGTAEWIANGIAWAGTHGAHVLNLSLGFGPQDPGPPVSTAIAQTAAAGTVICAAAGNEAQPQVSYPAAYEQCIAVGATDRNDALAPYSNYGAAIDVVAPGGNTSQQPSNGVASTCCYDGQQHNYCYMQGTSMATPHVTGVAALLRSLGRTPEEVRQALQQTAVDLGAPGWDQQFGHGRINAAAALRWQGGSGSEQTLLSESFEAATYPPQGWQHFRGPQGDPQSPGFIRVRGPAHSGSFFVFHDDDDVATSCDDILATPGIAIPAHATAAHFRFWQWNDYMSPEWYEYHGVLISTDGLVWQQAVELYQACDNWTQVDLDFTALRGQTVYIGFRYRGDYATEWGIDDVTFVVTLPAAAREPLVVPYTMRLHEPHPNPFNSSTMIPFELAQPMRVSLAVYNLLGQKVADVLPMSPLNAGMHRVTWNAAAVSSGLYIVKLEGGAAPQSRKLMLVK